MATVPLPVAGQDVVADYRVMTYADARQLPLGAAAWYVGLDGAARPVVVDGRTVRSNVVLLSAWGIGIQFTVRIGSIMRATAPVALYILEG
jgi:hypothetical protein